MGFSRTKRENSGTSGAWGDPADAPATASWVKPFARHILNPLRNGFRAFNATCARPTWRPRRKPAGNESPGVVEPSNARIRIAGHPKPEIHCPPVGDKAKARHEFGPRHQVQLMADVSDSGSTSSVVIHVNLGPIRILQHPNPL
jgi:hypothetical protein